MPIDEKKELEKIRRELVKLIASEPALRAIAEVNESLAALAEHINSTIDRINDIENEEWIDNIEALEKERREFAPELTPDEARKIFHSKMFTRIMRGDFGREIDDQFILMSGVAIYIYEKKYWPLREEWDRSTTEFKKR